MPAKDLRFPKRVLSEIAHGENIDAYVAIALGITLTVLGVMGGLKVQWLQNFTIFVLTFLVLVALKNRQSSQDATRLLQAAKSTDASQMLIDRSDYQPLDDRLSGAQEAIIVGRHLLGFVGYNRDAIRKFAREGCEFRFLVADPSVAGASGDVELSLRILEEIRSDVPQKILVRLTSRVLPCAIFAVDMATPRGLIQVQPHTLFADSDLRPHYDLRASFHSQWYGYYRDQIDLLWKDSQPVVPHQRIATGMGRPGRSDVKPD